MNILLVEDDELFSRLLVDYMAGNGLRTTRAPSAEEGLRLLGTRHFDLVMCDMHLPGMGGQEFFSKLNKLNIKTTKVLITGHPISLDSSTEQNHADLVLIKPFSLKTLANTLRALLGNPEDTQANNSSTHYSILDKHDQKEPLHKKAIQ